MGKRAVRLQSSSLVWLVDLCIRTKRFFHANATVLRYYNKAEIMRLRQLLLCRYLEQPRLRAIAKASTTTQSPHATAATEAQRGGIMAALQAPLRYLLPKRAVDERSQSTGIPASTLHAGRVMR